MSAAYQTKVMKAANVIGLPAAKEALEKAIVEAEQAGHSGDVAIVVLLRGGSIISVRQTRNHTVPLPQPNN